MYSVQWIKDYDCTFYMDSISNCWRSKLFNQQPERIKMKNATVWFDRENKFSLAATPRTKTYSWLMVHTGRKMQKPKFNWSGVAMVTLHKRIFNIKMKRFFDWKFIFFVLCTKDETILTILCVLSSQTISNSKIIKILLFRLVKDAVPSAKLILIQRKCEPLQFYYETG